MIISDFSALEFLEVTGTFGTGRGEEKFVSPSSLARLMHISSAIAFDVISYSTCTSVDFHGSSKSSCSGITSGLT